MSKLAAQGGQYIGVIASVAGQSTDISRSTYKSNASICLSKQEELSVERLLRARATSVRNDKMR